MNTARSCSVGASAAAASEAGGCMLGCGGGCMLGSDGCVGGGDACSCSKCCGTGIAICGSNSCIGCGVAPEGKLNKGEASLEPPLDHGRGETLERLEPPNRDWGTNRLPGRGPVLLRAAVARSICGHTTSGRSWTRRGVGAFKSRSAMRVGPSACEESGHERAWPHDECGGSDPKPMKTYSNSGFEKEASHPAARPKRSMSATRSVTEAPRGFSHPASMRQRAFVSLLEADEPDTELDRASSRHSFVHAPSRVFATEVP